MAATKVKTAVKSTKTTKSSTKVKTVVKQLPASVNAAIENADLLAMCKAWEKMKAKQKDLDAQKKALEVALKEKLAQAKVDEMCIDKYTVRYTPYIKNSFNSTKFKKENGALYEEYCETKEQKQFAVDY